MNCVSRSLKIFVCLAAVLACFAQDTGDLHKGVAAFAAGRYQEARSAMEAFIESAHLPAGDARLVTATEVLASSLQKLGDLAAAADFHLSVLASADGNTVDGARAIELAANNLGSIRVEQGRWDEAASLLEKGVALHRRSFGGKSPVAAIGMENLGTLRLIQGHLEQAVPLLEQAVQILRQAAPEYTVDLVSSLRSLGSAYTQLAEYSIALPLLEEAVSGSAALSERDPVAADAIVGLASLFLAQRMPDRAEPLLRKALAIYEGAGALNRMRGAGVLTQLGLLRLRERKYVAAEQYFRRALEILRRAFGPGHVSTAAAEVNLAIACLRLEKYQESGTLLQHSFAIQNAAFGESQAMARWLDVRAEWESRLGHRTEADARFREAIAMFEKTAGADHPLTAEALLDYADFLRHDRKKEATALQRRATEILSLRSK
ncbi:exported hypothetical protein [Candidatus Sulfopaludibacter sp. SbA3]|nr:exported hypothetical protein [Candidatus Sulfopaludibacter sp. SbA3]